MKKLLSFSLVVFSGLLLFVVVNSCSTSSTMITGTWNTPAVEKVYNHILVAALTTTVSSKSTIEQKIAQNLSKEGVSASQSMEILPPRFIEDENQKKSILNAIRTNGSDAILTVSLIDKDTESRYIPGTGTYAPYPVYGFYSNFWGYYDYWYPQFHMQGYYKEDKIYYIETNLYDAETENLIWSAQSETYNPIDLSTFSEDFAEEIVKQLAKDNII